MNTEGKKIRNILSFALIAIFLTCLCSMASAQEKPNLTPFPPPNCSGDSIIVKNPSCTQGCDDDSPLYNTDTLYFAWGVQNNGTAPTTTNAGIYIYVDGKLIVNNGMAIPPLSVGQTSGCLQAGQGGGAACLNCPSVTGLCPGEHTIRFVVDSLSTIAESNEADNEYTRTIFISSNPQTPQTVFIDSITVGGTYYNFWQRGQNIPTNATITIKYNMSVDTTTGFVALRDEYENDIPGTVQWSRTCSDNDTVTLIPNHALKPATHYQLHAQAWSVGGVGIGTPDNAFDFNFFTKPSTADTTPPVVQTVYPYEGMTGVSTRTEILIKFSEAMNPGSINSPNNITLSGDGISFPSDYNVSYDFTQGFARIKKNTPLSPSKEYTVTVTPNVRDLRGNWLKERYQWKFITEAADSNPPTVIQTIPADGATNVSPYLYIHVVFSEEMDQNTLNNNSNNIEIHDKISGNDYFFNPITNNKDSVTFFPPISDQGPLLLPYGHEIEIIIGSGVKDLAGNSVTPYSFSFTVADIGVDSAPVLLEGIGPDFQRGERWGDGSSRLVLELSAYDDQITPLTVTASTPSSSWPLSYEDNPPRYFYESTVNENLSLGTNTLTFTIKDGASPQNQVTFQRDIYIFESPPILSSPTNRASGVSTTPTFEWSYNPTDRPFLHTLAVFDGPDPKTARVVWQDFAYDNGGATYSLSIPADKPLASNTTYYWSVWGENKQGNGVTYSAMRSFTTGGTPPPEPRFQKVVVRSDDRPTGLRWNLIASVLGPSPADIVDLKVTGPQGFQYIFTEDDILQGEQLGLYFSRPFSTSLPNGNYTFTVTDSQGRTAIANFNLSNSSTEIQRVASSTMLPPDNSYLNTTTPTFRWTGVGSGYYYRVVVMDWNSKADAVYYSDFTQNTQITVPSGYLLPNTPYKWRVDVYDVPWNNRSVSATLRFSTGSYPYTLDISSAYGWSDNNYYNRSTRNLGAVVTGPLPNEVTQINVTGPSFNHNFIESEIQYDLMTEGIQYGYGGGAFPSDGIYTFNVQDKYGATDSLSKEQTSTAIPIVDQVSLSPANNAYIDTLTPTLTWAAAAGSNLYYRVKINDWMGRYTVYNSPVSAGLYATIPSGILQPNRSYKWRVEVFDNVDKFVADNRSSSAWNSFTTTANFIPDSDGDGLDDAWERLYFRDLRYGANDDPDGDGLNNLLEYQIGTNPNNPDSDGDGLWDSVDEQPIILSNVFSDAATTNGRIESGDQVLITDEPDPDGVRIKAESPATVSVCGDSATISLNASDEVVVTCGSVTINVVQGTIDITFTATDGTTATTTLVENYSLEFEPTTFTFTAPETNPQRVVIVVEDKEFSIPAGETLTVINIDIKPGSYPNSISLKKKGTIPVAILSTAGFHAPSLVNRNSLTFGKTGDESSLDFCSPSPKDVNNDGLGDLICHFTVQETNFTTSDTVGILRGEKLDGGSIEATDSVRIIP